jgi:hypothetical protein
VLDHLWCHVDTDRMTRWSDLCRRQENIQPAAETQIDNDLTRSQTRGRNRIAAGHTEIHLGGNVADLQLYTRTPRQPFEPMHHDC